MKIERTCLDSKGRALIPKSFREAIGLRESDPIYVSLDGKNNVLVLGQYAESNVYQITIKMGDTPGTLAKLANVFSENMVDLIATESHSTLRTKDATWRVICSCKTDIKKLKIALRINGATSVAITKL